jgi:hypothetical protein
MKTLNVKQRLEFALRGLEQLRKLADTKTKMEYENFAKTVGLIGPGEAWEVQHREQVTAILSILGAVERQGWGGNDKTAKPIEFEWIVNKKGEPGAGFAKNSKINRTPAKPASTAIALTEDKMSLV